MKSYEWAFKLAQECASKIELMILGIPRFNTQEELRGFPLTLGNLGDKSGHDFTKPNATFPMVCSIGNELLSFFDASVVINRKLRSSEEDKNTYAY